MISMDKKYTTRDGWEVRLVCVDGPSEKYPVVGFVGNGVYAWSLDGCYFAYRESSHDLIEAEALETIEIDVWVNVYDDGILGGPYTTKENADNAGWCNSGRKACINIKRTVTVGEGL